MLQWRQYIHPRALMQTLTEKNASTFTLGLGDDVGLPGTELVNHSQISVNSGFTVRNTLVGLGESDTIKLHESLRLNNDAAKKTFSDSHQLTFGDGPDTIVMQSITDFVLAGSVPNTQQKTRFPTGLPATYTAGENFETTATIAGFIFQFITIEVLSVADFDGGGLMTSRMSGPFQHIPPELVVTNNTALLIMTAQLGHDGGTPGADAILNAPGTLAQVLQIRYTGNAGIVRVDDIAVKADT